MIMEKKIIIGMGLLFSSFTYAEVNNPNKFAALAVDRNNGFAYGFAYDHPKSTIAEKKALDECNTRSKNSNCSVVLSWSGDGCGVYRSIDGNVGTAYGWGIAKSRGEADIIATREAQKRSAGQNVTNHVWACNSNVKNKLNIIKNLSPSEKKAQANVKTVTIGSQIWMAENLSTSKFANNEKIPLLNSIDEYKKKGNEETPQSIILKNEHLYNWYAAADSRNICPAGFRVPTVSDFNILINTVGANSTNAAIKLKSKNIWKNPGTDDYNFTAKPIGALMWNYGDIQDTTSYRDNTEFWSTTTDNDSNRIGRYFLFDGNNNAKITGNKKTTLASVRCIKD